MVIPYIKLNLCLQTKADTRYLCGLFCADADEYPDMTDSEKSFFRGTRDAQFIEKYVTENPLPENEEAKQFIQYKDFLLAQRENIKMLHKRDISKLLKAAKKYNFSECCRYAELCEKAKQEILCIKTETCCPNIAENLVTITPKQFDDYIEKLAESIKKDTV